MRLQNRAETLTIVSLRSQRTKNKRKFVKGEEINELRRSDKEIMSLKKKIIQRLRNILRFVENAVRSSSLSRC